MKKLIILFFALALITRNSIGQVAGFRLFNFSTGVSIPVHKANVQDFWKIGFNFGLGVEFPFIKSIVFQFYYEYNNFKINDKEYIKKLNLDQQVLDINPAALTLTNISGNFKFNLPTYPGTKLNPYLLIGVGYLKYNVGEIIIETKEYIIKQAINSEISFSSKFGLGLNYKIQNNAYLFFDVKFVQVFQESGNIKYFPISFGISIK